MTDVLVIIVTWNGMEWISRCLRSVENSTVPADVIVIDNGSTDGTLQLLKEENVRLIERPDNPGFGAANNIGLEYAMEHGYRYVYLLNQDAWVEPDTLGLLIEGFKSGEYGILSPVQNDAGGSEMDANFRRKCGKALKRASRGQSPVEVPFVMAAHWMVSRACLAAVGGFSPSFHQYGEDDNYIDRAHFKGFKVGVVPKARAVHDRKTRNDSKERRMRLKCIAAVVKVSDPNASLAWRLIREPLELLGMSLLRRSSVPLKFIPHLIGRYPELIRNRRSSTKDAAFLTSRNA